MNEGSKSSGCGVFAVRTDMLFYPSQAFKFMSFFWETKLPSCTCI